MLIIPQEFVCIEKSGKRIFQLENEIFLVVVVPVPLGIIKSLHKVSEISENTIFPEKVFPVFVSTFTVPVST
jgi:hypothetical protein